MKMPIFRAKGEDRAYYFEGDLITEEGVGCFIGTMHKPYTRIEKDTLSINIQQVDVTKRNIFFSLQDDYTGADIVVTPEENKYYAVYDAELGSFLFKSVDGGEDLPVANTKVRLVGIKTPEQGDFFE